MKKLLLSVGMFSLAVAANAQSSKLTLNNRAASLEKKHSQGSTKQVTGSLVCNTQYVAGTTMDLSFTLNLTNTDDEYCDLLTLTFPAGITPNSSANDPLVSPAINASATGTQLNAISGQSISWGTDDDANQYGGIPTGTPVNFTVNVTIDAALTGNQLATFVADGDTYITGTATTAGDLNGDVTIYPAGASLPNLYVMGVRPMNNISLDRTCGHAVDTVLTLVKNIGNTTESAITVNFSVNGGTVASTVIPGPLAPGDSTFAFFLPAYDFTGAEIKNIKAWVDLASDIDHSNDTITEGFVNTVTTTLTSSNYSNGIESAFDLASLLSLWDQSKPGTGFGPSTGTKHTGAQALFYTVNTTIGAPVGDYETYLVLPCTDVVAGETYKVSYWRKANTSTTLTINGNTGIFVGLGQDLASITDTLKPYSAITPNAQALAWQKDSVEYAATTSGTVYFSIGGKGTVANGTGVNIRIDDILIEKLQTSGINENTMTTTVYPNPVSDVLNIKVNGVISNVTITTLDGKVVKSTAASTLNVSDLTSGMYIYQVTANGKVSTGNFVKN